MIKNIEYKNGVDNMDIFFFTVPMLLLFSYVAYYYKTVLQKPMIVTSLRKDRVPRINDVHFYGRGCDVRTHSLDHKEKKALLADIISRFHYDNFHKCAIIHGEGGNEHLHLQVPENVDKYFKKF